MKVCKLHHGLHQLEELCHSDQYDSSNFVNVKVNLLTFGDESQLQAASLLELSRGFTPSWAWKNYIKTLNNQGKVIAPNNIKHRTSIPQSMRYLSASNGKNST